MLKAIFSKTSLMLIVLLFMVLWLGGGMLNQFIHLPGAQVEAAQEVTVETTLATPNATPAVVTWLTQAVQPIADDLRQSFDLWWAGQKEKLALQASQWLSQQEKLMLDVVKVKLQEWVNQTLGVSTASAQ